MKQKTRQQLAVAGMAIAGAVAAVYLVRSSGCRCGSRNCGCGSPNVFGVDHFTELMRGPPNPCQRMVRFERVFNPSINIQELAATYHSPGAGLQDECALELARRIKEEAAKRGTTPKVVRQMWKDAERSGTVVGAQPSLLDAWAGDAYGWRENYERAQARIEQRYLDRKARTARGYNDRDAAFPSPVQLKLQEHKQARAITRRRIDRLKQLELKAAKRRAKGREVPSGLRRRINRAKWAVRSAARRTRQTGKGKKLHLIPVKWQRGRKLRKQLRERRR